MKRITCVTLVLCAILMLGLTGCKKKNEFDEAAYNKSMAELQSRASIVGPYVHEVGDVVEGWDLVELSEDYEDVEGLKVNIEMDRIGYDHLPTEEVGKYEVGLGIMFPDGKLWVQQYEYTVIEASSQDKTSN